MSNDEILRSFSEILAGLLAEDSIELDMQTTRADVPGWDSFNYINFIVAVEAEHGIKFRVADVESFSTVGEIVSKLRELKPD